LTKCFQEAAPHELMPRLLNYIVAIYLIVVGITGLGLIR
jgi:hypothetical protein